MKYYLTITALFVSLILSAQQEDAARRRNFNIDTDGIAIREFDPVSYFKNKPAKGDPKIYYEYKRITYCFLNDANREEFKKSPAKYEPAFGGWCAYTMATTGTRAKINPFTYKIVEGKLYLFSDFNGSNALLKWNLDEKKFKAAATQNWIKTMR